MQEQASTMPISNSNVLTVSVFLRSLVFNVLMTLLTVFFSLSSTVLLLAPFKVRYFYITRWSHSIIFLARHICGIRYNIEGLENIPSSNAIVLCNHQSTWETLFLQTLLPMQSWVLKRELLWVPFFGWGLWLLNPIAINRNNTQSIKHLIKKGKEYLQEGRWVIIFPEGTRMKPGEKKKYSRSGAILAKETQFPLLPIAHNAGNFWPKGSFFKYPGTIQVFIGPLVSTNTSSTEKLTQDVQDWIQRHS